MANTSNIDQHANNATPEHNLFIISDIHGMDEQFEQLLTYWNPQDMLVLLGDFVDRGLQSRDVLQRVLALKKAFPAQVRLCLGNHVEMFLGFLREPSDAYSSYSRVGGEATIQSLVDGLYLTERPVTPHEKAMLIQRHYTEEIALLKNAPRFLEIGSVLLTHAGFDSSSSSYRDSSDQQFIWIREHYKRPNTTPFVNVFGHTPVRAIHGVDDVWLSEDKRYIGVDGGAFFTGQLNAVLLNKQGEVLATYKVNGEGAMK